jgi:hypothetical protein
MSDKIPGPIPSEEELYSDPTQKVTSPARKLQRVELEKMSFSEVQKGLAENRFRLPD